MKEEGAITMEDEQVLIVPVPSLVATLLNEERSEGRPLTENEVNAMNPNVLMSDELFDQLNNWVDKHYRDQLTVKDLADPQLIIESRTALDEQTQILKLGSVYHFQK